MNPSLRKILVRALKLFLLVYALVGIALFYLQDKILLHPEKQDPSKPYAFSQPHKELMIPYRKDVSMSVVQFLVDTARFPDPKGVVLYFHGNRQNMARYADQSALFTAQGYECWMIDYPGFGKSDGTFQEAAVYEWALTFYKLARAKYSRDSIILYGRSLGTGIAAQLASVRDCKRLFLETPYYDLPSLVGHYLPIYPVHRIIQYKFPTHEYLQQVTAPVTIFQGDQDWTTPLSEAKKLRKYFKPGDEFIKVKGGHHNDLTTFKEVRARIGAL